MKKRLLITSIVMMLVVAVALSTATYAWFTSNARVTANSFSMKATTSTAPALGISWTDGNYGTEISPVITSFGDDDTFVFSPVAPASLSTSATITTSDVEFKTSTTYASGGDFKFGAETGGVDAAHETYVVTDGDGHTSFFLKNMSGTNAFNGTLTMTATITGNGADLMRVGVFKYNSSASTTDKYELIEVLANPTYTYTAVEAGTALTGGANSYYKMVNGQYVAAVAGTAQEVTNGTADYYRGADPDAGTPDYTGATTAVAGKFFTQSAEATGHATAVNGTITNGASVNAMSRYTCAESLNLGTNLAHDTVIELRVIVWMDGAALGDAQQGFVGNIVLNFTVA